MKRPEGVSDSDFSAAMAEFAGVVGKDWTFTSEEDVALYNDSYSPFVGEPEKAYEASAAVAPHSVEEVQQVVRIANKYKVPLYAISTGRNLGYGGSSPTMSGCVIVDLKRMNRIVDVDVRQATMIVEPGVSFIDLQQHFDEHNYPFFISTPDPGWGSPVGNAMDHGIGYAAGDNFGMVHGLEVVLPNGELIRTGMGSVPTSKNWLTYRYGFGPFINGMFSQANYGIVTKMGFWLVPKPDLQQGFTVDTYNSEDMQALIDVAQAMRHQNLLISTSIGSPIRESMATNDGRQPFGTPEVNRLHLKKDGGTFKEWDKLAKDLKIPSLRAGGVARGPKPIVDATLEYAREMFSKVPGAEFKIGNPIPMVRPRIEFGLFGVQPTSHGHYYFSPMFPMIADDIWEVNKTIHEQMLAMDDSAMRTNFGWSAGRGTSYPKANMILMEFLVFDDVALNKKRRELFKRLVRACGEKGYAEYRAPVAFQSDVMEQYAFNNHSLRKFLEQVKDGIDPNGILSPGKSGVWPARYRKA